MDRQLVGSPRIEFSGHSLGLAVGDGLAITAFIVAGELRHGVDPIVYPWLVLDSLAPFLLSWAVAALLFGQYTARAVRSPGHVALLALPAWIIANLAAHALRATSFFHGGTELSFIAVTLVFGILFVVGWRIGYAVLRQ